MSQQVNVTKNPLGEASSKMECDAETIENDVVFAHRVCLTHNAKWLCLQDIYEKFHRPNIYDIGGTYLNDLPDFWFTYKTEQVGKIFLLHIFFQNRQERSFNINLSGYSDISVDKKSDRAYLPTLLKTFSNIEASDGYITTYSFSDLDVGLLKDKKLLIAVNFPSVDKDIDSNVLEQVKMHHDLRTLLSDPVGSDFTIESEDGEKFNVHKVILAAQSDVFKAMLEGDMAEKQNSYLKLIDVNKEDLKCVLQYIYTGTVVDIENQDYASLLKLADRYNLKGLHHLAEHIIIQNLTIDNAIDIVYMADLFNSELLKLAALKFIKRNPCSLESASFKMMNNTELLRELCCYMAPAVDSNYKQALDRQVSSVSKVSTASRADFEE